VRRQGLEPEPANYESAGQDDAALGTAVRPPATSNGHRGRLGPCGSVGAPPSGRHATAACATSWVLPTEEIPVPDVEGLPGACLSCWVAGGAAEEGPVLAGLDRRPRNRGDQPVSDLPVGPEIALAAQVLIVHTSDAEGIVCA
jgi:hypothetical protein